MAYEDLKRGGTKVYPNRPAALYQGVQAKWYFGSQQVVPIGSTDGSDPFIATYNGWTFMVKDWSAEASQFTATIVVSCPKSAKEGSYLFHCYLLDKNDPPSNYRGVGVEFTVSGIQSGPSSPTC